MKYDLKDKYVIITGASGGIGSALAAVMIRKYGAKVIGVGRNEEKIKSIKNSLGDNFEYELFDVSVKENWTAFAEKLTADGKQPTLLINNAGVFPEFRRTAEVSSEVFERVMKNNFLSAVYGTEALLPLLYKSKEPGVFNICSSAALCTVAGTGAYTASKSALRAYTEALILEKKEALYVGAAYPGVTLTDLFRSDVRVAKSGVDKIAAPPDKTALKIAKAVIKRKKRAVVGFDALAMSFMARIFPKFGPAVIAYVMKKSGAEVFSDVF